MEKAYRRIKTFIPATVGYKAVFDGVQGQMSDGIWENNGGMYSYWADLKFDVEDGDIVVCVRAEEYIREYGGFHKNRYYGKTNKQVLNYLAKKIRDVIRIEDKDNLEMSSCTPEEFHRRYFLKDTVPVPERKNFKWAGDNDTLSTYLGYSDRPVMVKDAFNVVVHIKTV